jgi:CubicO group peptidase (beta-lactamase class C family)
LPWVLSAVADMVAAHQQRSASTKHGKMTRMTAASTEPALASAVNPNGAATPNEEMCFLASPVGPIGSERSDRVMTYVIEEALKPLGEPGTAQGYRMVSFGFILGELVRRVTGRTLGQYLRTEIAEPLGIDIHIGLPKAEHHRCAAMVTSRTSATCSPTARPATQRASTNTRWRPHQWSTARRSISRSARVPK